MRCGNSASASSTPKRATFLAAGGFAAFERFGGAALQLAGDFVVEALDRGDFVKLDIGHFLEAGEAFGDQQLGERLVDVEVGLEHFRPLDEFALALLGGVGLGQNVDLAGGQLAGETDVLSAAADGKAQLIVGHDHFDAAFLLVDDDAATVAGCSALTTKVARSSDQGMMSIFSP